MGGESEQDGNPESGGGVKTSFKGKWAIGNATETGRGYERRSHPTVQKQKKRVT